MTDLNECPRCGASNLVLLSTHDAKFCNDCKIYMAWKLKDGQPSVYGDRIGGRDGWSSNPAPTNPPQ